MKTKAEIHNFLENVPVPKSHGHTHHHFHNTHAAILFAIIQTLLGITCIVFTEQIHLLFPIILGIFMICLGCCDILRSVATKEYCKEETKLISNGIIVLVLGFVILFLDDNADQIIGAIWGVIGLYKGSEVLNAAIYSLSEKKPFLRSTLHGLIDMLLGIALLIDPMTAVTHHLFILGIELIILGIQSVAEAQNKLS